MEVGTGAPGAWRAFAEGDTLLLQRGLQGAQHVFVSVRIRDAAVGPMDLDIELRRVRDDEVVGMFYSGPIEMDRQLDERTWETTGLTPVVPNPDDVLHEDIRIRVTAMDVTGGSVVVDRLAHVVWGPGWPG